MFTGIIETTGKVLQVEPNGTNLIFWVESNITHELKIDQSVAHNGVCLTVTDIKNNAYSVTAVNETIIKTNIANWLPGSTINIERCMPANGRFDGHIVQGHVDCTATVSSITDVNGSWNVSFILNNPENNHLMVNKGSVCINGVSLTLVEVNNSQFSVTIIPYTWFNTNFNTLKAGDTVNIEFDIVGKYIAKMLQARGN